ncbi:MAG: aspartate 1-decarboxylase [Phycisphaerae bacterium]|nr:aspartate 1-decarboxylase [Phycisphaerae bacterium]
MLRSVLHSKIHFARVTGAFPEYVGSITIDADLLRVSGMRASDLVAVANCRTGERLETYIFAAPAGSRRIELNGAAARLFEVGDRVIVMHYALMTDEEYRGHRPTVLIMSAENEVKEVMRYEPGPFA